MRLSSLLFALCTLAIGSPALAQSDYPNKPIKIIVPFSPGGVGDLVARLVGAQLGSKIGQPVIIDNRPGAGGLVGNELVARAPADGYTLLLATPSLATLPSLNKDLRWDPTRDFRGISMFGMVPNVFVVSAQSPVTTMRDLVSLAAKSKEAVSYGSPGIGSTNHLAGELLAQEANVKLVHVPYKGQSEAVTDLLGNRLSMMPLTSAIALPYIQSGRLRPLAVSTGKRITALPDVPTVAEALYLPGYDVSSWFGLAAPKQTPDAVVRKLNSDLASVLAQPDVKEGLAKLGMERLVLSPAAFDAFIRQQTVSFGRVIKQAGIEAR